MNIKNIEHFEIIEKIGQGGMGAVYKARDVQKNTIVALKILSCYSLNTDLMKRRFQREATAGLRLDHPNIVKIHEVGEADDELFISMEYISGQTLRELLADGPLPVNKAIGIGISAARALECAHGIGIVHRDIKSDNIMITGDGIIKVMDFGLAKIQGASMLTMEGEVLGTVSYMSPQQTQGETIDHRSDIFSLGVVLYELLTGRLPFSGDYDMAIIYAIINEDPLTLREVNDEIPVPLEQVILKCLQKDLSQRYQKVSELIDDLDRVQAYLETDGLQPTISSQIPSVRSDDAGYEIATPVAASGIKRFQTQLFGREKELHTLINALEQSTSGQGQIIFIKGEAGVGKTRLVQELERYARTIKIKTLKGRCLYRQMSYPYQPFVDAINEYFIQLDVLDEKKLTACIEKKWPELVRFLPVIRTFLNMADSAVIESKEQLWEAVNQLIIRISDETPFILYIDDLHWAEQDSIDLLRSIVIHVQNTHLLLIGTYRPEDIRSDDHPLVKLIEESTQENILSLISLTRIDRDSIKKIVRSILKNTNIDEAFCQRLYEETEGNPLFLMETLKLMIVEHALIKDDGGYSLTENYDNISIPTKIQDIVLRRIERLDPDERELLEIGAVEGESFHSDTINSCMEINRLQLLKKLQYLEREHHIIYPRDKMYQFDHAKIQEFLYDAITPELQTEYHIRIGNYLAQSYGSEEVMTANIAHHFLMGEQYTQALPYLVKSAERAKQLFANQQAIEAYQKALEIIPRSNASDSINLTDSILEGLGDVLTITGRHEEGEDNYKRLLERSTQVSPKRLERLWKLGSLYLSKGDYDKALTTLNDAEIEYINNLKKIKEGETAQANSKPEIAGHELICLLGKIKISRARIYKAHGNYEPAKKEIEEGLQMLSEEHNLTGMGQAYNDFGNILFDKGEYAQSEQKYLKSLEIRKTISDKKGMAETYNNLGTIYIEQGEYGKAAEMMEKSIELMQSIGFTVGIAGTGLNLGSIYQDQGRYDDAYAMHQQSYTLSKKMDNKPIMALSLSNLGLVCIEQKEFSDAVNYLQESLDLMEQLDFRINEPQTQVWLSQALLETGEYEKAKNLALAATENAQKLQQKANLGIAKRWLAAIELRLNSNDSALAANCTLSKKIKRLLMEGLIIFDELRMEHEYGRSCLELVRYYRRLNNRPQTQEYLKKAQIIFKKLGAMGDLKKLEKEIIH